MSNIGIVSHGFRERAKAISKTARRCRRSMRAAKPASVWRSCHGLRTFRRSGRARARRANRQHGCRDMRAVASCAPPRSARDHPARKLESTANTEPFNQLLVTLLIRAPEVIENLAPLRHELQKPAPRMVVLDMGLEVLGQVVDALR